MIERQTFRRIVAESLSAPLPEVIPRDVKVDLNSPSIVALAGVRRAGKTYETFSIMKALMGQGVPRSRLLYVNFEDERLRGIGKDQLQEIIDVYHELSGSSQNERPYLFLDEVQNAEGWESWVMRLHDEGVRIFVTGSSSKLLSREIATALAGRQITYLIFPFSFKEFLSALSFNADPVSIYLRWGEAMALVSAYLTYGGFPEVVLTREESTKLRLLSSYYDSIVFRDIVERYSVRDTSTLTALLRYAASSYGNQFSSSKAYNYLKSNGIRVSKKTVDAYLDHAKSVFFLFELFKYSKGFKRSNQARRKAYLVDNGFASLFGALDWGRLLENAAFLELQRITSNDPTLSVNYWSDGGEVDFVLSRRGQPVQAIQVTYELSESNRKRELGPLVEVASQTGAEPLLITYDRDGEEVYEGKRVAVASFARWALQPPRERRE
ncbi:ATP-binding protein [Tardisphaera miroshnichenkoae]